MIFSKNTILKKIEQKLITITNFDSNALEDASYDFKLGSYFDEIKQSWIPVSSAGLQIEPKGFLLAKTSEKITLSPQVACMIFTTSSLAKKGIDAIQSSSFCHPKTDNEMTLEIFNHSNQSVNLKQGQTVVKGVFMEVV
jgi:deoxycytidine triphosphate deaminase